MTLAAHHRWRAIVVAAAAALAVAVLGGLSTDIGPWYAGLRKPPWQPPDLLFGPVWTLIYALTAAAGAQAWWHATGPRARQNVLIVLACNAVLNVVWSLLFFRLHRPDWALVEVVPLWLSIVAMMVVLGRMRRIAALLLLPYLLWVAFAALLNAAVVRLNAPFTTFGASG